MDLVWNMCALPTRLSKNSLMKRVSYLQGVLPKTRCGSDRRQRPGHLPSNPWVAHRGGEQGVLGLGKRAHTARMALNLLYPKPIIKAGDLEQAMSVTHTHGLRNAQCFGGIGHSEGDYRSAALAVICL